MASVSGLQVASLRGGKPGTQLLAYLGTFENVQRHRFRSIFEVRVQSICAVSVCDRIRRTTEEDGNLA